MTSEKPYFPFASRTLCWLGKVEIPLPIVFRMAVQVSSGLCIPQFWLGDPLKWFGEVPKSLLR